MPDGDDEPMIRVSVRGLTDELKTDFRERLDAVSKEMARSFGRLEKGLEGKADKADIERVEKTLREHQTELDSHRSQIQKLETQQKSDEKATETTEKITKARHDRLSRMYAAAGVAAGGFGAWFTFLLSHGHH